MGALKSSTRRARSAQIAMKKHLRMEELISKERYPQALGGTRKDEELPYTTSQWEKGRIWTFGEDPPSTETE